jgi:homoserine O-acetyltransferase
MPQIHRAIFVLCAAALAAAAGVPEPVEGDFVIRDFRFTDGSTLPELRLHYAVLGQPHRNTAGVVDNAVLILHGTGGSGRQFLSERFAGVLFGPGQLLDISRYYIILPDAIGHGKSSKPSDGLHSEFPHFTYADMITAQYRLITEGLRVNHLRLVMGTSMGGMHTWMWGETHPDFMDALMPLACAPVQIAGRNRVFRKMIMDAIRKDPDWNGGEYIAQPRGLVTAIYVLYIMGSSAKQAYKTAPTRDEADNALHQYVQRRLRTTDANDLLYQVDASRDYDPSPGLEKIRAPLFAINSADDVINPPELGIVESQIQRVPRGRYILLPITDETRGHGTHTLAAVWQDYLRELLEASGSGQMSAIRARRNEVR